MNYLLPRVTRPVGAETHALIVPLAPLLTHVAVVKQALRAQLQAAATPTDALAIASALRAILEHEGDARGAAAVSEDPKVIDASCALGF